MKDLNFEHSEKQILLVKVFEILLESYIDIRNPIQANLKTFNRNLSNAISKIEDESIRSNIFMIVRLKLRDPIFQVEQPVPYNPPEQRRKFYSQRPRKSRSQIL